MTIDKKPTRGRPLKSEEENTQARILQAARELFVKNGFAATSISDIARSANINQSLIYHHCGNKQELWKKVKQYVLKAHRELPPLIIDERLTLSTFLNHIIKQRAEIYENNPDLCRMMLWQRLEDSKETLMGGTTASPDIWQESIKFLINKGEIRYDLDPDFVIALISNAITGIYLYPSSLYENSHNRNLYIEKAIICLRRGLGEEKNPSEFQDL